MFYEKILLFIVVVEFENAKFLPLRSKDLQKDKFSF